MTASTGNNPQLGMQMTNSSMRMGYIFAAHEKNSTGKKITNGYLISSRDNKAKELGAQYDTNPDIVVSKYASCKKWDGAITEYINKHGEEADVLAIPPMKPTNSRPTDDDKKSVNAAFTAWKQMSQMAHEDVKKMLQKIIDDSKK